MEKNQYIVALEIGSSKIVGAMAEKSSSGMVSVKHLVKENLTNCVRYGCVQNVENIKGSINRILTDLERRVGGRVTSVYMGVSGRSLHNEVSEENRSLDASKGITDEIIASIIKDAGRKPIKNYETIDVVPRAYYVDKAATPNPVGQFGSSIKIKVNLIVAKPAIKLNLNRVMSFGVKVKDYLVTPLAVGEHVLSDRERSLGCMLVDLGAETTTVAIYKEDALLYLNTLPLGGRNITRDIMNGLNVLEDTAEKVKVNISSPLDPGNGAPVVIEGVTSTDAANYISARNGEIMANINNQLTLAGLSTNDIRSIVLVGGGSQLQGLVAKLQETMAVNVTVGSYPSTLNLLDHSINRIENIEILSLIAKATEMIEPGETCVEIQTYDDGLIVQPNNEAADKKPADDEDDDKRGRKGKKKEKKQSGWAAKIGSALKNLMSEDEEEYDE